MSDFYKGMLGDAVSAMRGMAERIRTLEGELEEAQKVWGSAERVVEALGDERDALAAQLAKMREGLQSTLGLLNEMHAPTQGHSAEACTGRTDFCDTSLMVTALLAEPTGDSSSVRSDRKVAAPAPAEPEVE